MNLAVIFFASIITNNIVLTYFLGICPFISTSKDFLTSVGMGCAVTFVMILTCTIIWPINHYFLIPYGMDYLQYAVFILVIGVLVQIVEIAFDRYLPVLYVNMGIFLPLIVVNCAIFGTALFMSLRNYTYIQSLVFSLGCGIGWTLAICAMAGIRMKLRFATIPQPLEGIGITLISIAIMAMGFMGFAGFIRL